MKVAQSCLTLFCPWNSLGQNTGVGSLSFLQRIFLTQQLNQGLLHCRCILYQLRSQGSPYQQLSVMENYCVSNQNFFFFNLSTTGILGQIILCSGDYSEHCRTYSRISGLYLLQMQIVLSPTFLRTKNTSSHCQKYTVTEGGKIFLKIREIRLTHMMMQTINFWLLKGDGNP